MNAFLKMACGPHQMCAIKDMLDRVQPGVDNKAAIIQGYGVRL